MKEHLLAIAFLGLLFLLYLAPMPESLLNKNTNTIKEELILPQNKVNSEEIKEIQPSKIVKDTTRTSVVAATRL
ncbi:MAG: hypothetical protein AB8F74_09505 [Saprospiraceae bacterium]